MAEENKTTTTLTAYAPDNVANKEEYINLIKKELINGKKNGAVTETELLFFLNVCKSSGLNPLTRQIYAIYRGDKMTIQAGIDGLRAIAERSGKYAGSKEGEFEYEKEGDSHPHRATVTVLKIMGGKVYETTASAVWNEYYVSSSPMWTKMPETMLAKCAEAKALRKAFPNIGQVYIEEEMEQAGKGNVVTEADVVKPDTKKIEKEVSGLVDKALDEKDKEKPENV